MKWLSEGSCSTFLWIRFYLSQSHHSPDIWNSSLRAFNCLKFTKPSGKPLHPLENFPGD